MPKISVIMPAYNAEKYLREAIDSILGQTFTDFELIVINDCSRDDTEQIILSYQDPRIVYLKNEKNLGVAGTLNRGLEVARGAYIARMDADDRSVPDRFQRQVGYMDANPLTVVCGSRVTVFSDDGQQRQADYPTEDAQIRATLLVACPFAHPSVMIRRQALSQLGSGYEEAFEKVEDYRLWTRLAEVGQLKNLEESLLFYRKHPGQVCATSSQVQYEGKLRLSAERLPLVGISDEWEQRLIVDAFDNRITCKEDLWRFAELAKRILKQTPPQLDKTYLRTLLKSRVIEIALAQGVTVPFGSMELLGIKAWLYVNVRGKK